MSFKSLLLSAIAIFICIGNKLDAQELFVKSFHQVTNDINWVPTQRKDLEGKICALLRVSLPYSEQTLFSGNVIGQVEYVGNEYWVYMSNGSQFLRVQYPNCETLTIDFRAHEQVGEVISKNVYELVLKVPKPNERMTPEEYWQETAEAKSALENKDFEKAISLYEAAKANLSNRNEMTFAHEVQENIDYCKRRIALNKLKAEQWKEMPQEGFCSFRSNNKYGFIDSIGNLAVPPIYDQVWEYRDGVAWVMKDSLWGNIDVKGNLIVPYTYKYISPIYPESYEQNRCLSVSKDMKYRGVVDYKTGEEILSCKYYQPYTFEIDRGPYFCYIDDKERPVFINKKTGREQFKLPSGIKFGYYLGDDGVCQVYKEKRKQHLYGLVDVNGNEIFPCEYHEFRTLDANPQFIIVDPFTHYLEIDTRLYNLKQRTYVGGKYTRIWGRHTDRLVTVYINLEYEELYGVLDYIANKEIIRPTHKIKDIELPTSEENPIIAKSSRKDRFGKDRFYLYDWEGNQYTVPSNDGRLNFQCGYSRIKQNGKYGYINAKGEIILPCKYDAANPFVRHGDLVATAVQEGKDVYCITPDGRRVDVSVQDLYKYSQKQ